jgi:hypothetical protein
MGILLTESKIINDDPENYMPFFLKNPPRLFESLSLHNKIKSMVGLPNDEILFPWRASFCLATVLCLD